MIGNGDSNTTGSEIKTTVKLSEKPNDQNQEGLQSVDLADYHTDFELIKTVFLENINLSYAIKLLDHA